MSATRPPGSFRFTRDQYYHLGRLGFFDGKRVERIRGEIFEMSPVGWPHVIGCRKTAERLERAFAGIGWVSRNEQPIALADSDPQPDVMVVAGRFEDYTDHPTAALLVVEVADTTLTRDTTTKAELYAENGIADYWVLDLEGRRLLVLRDLAPVAAGVTPTGRSSPSARPTALRRSPPRTPQPPSPTCSRSSAEMGPAARRTIPTCRIAPVSPGSATSAGPASGPPAPANTSPSCPPRFSPPSTRNPGTWSSIAPSGTPGMRSNC